MWDQDRSECRNRAISSNRYEITRRSSAGVIEKHGSVPQIVGMTQTHIIPAAFVASLALASLALAGSAQAACLAEYKAKQDDPLRLAHTTIEVEGPCTLDDVTVKVEEVLAEDGWTLLKLISVEEI